MWSVSAPCQAGEDEHPSPGGGPKAARDTAPRCQLRDGHSCGPSPHMPSRCHHGATSTPCTPLMCYGSTAASPDASTMPKVASAVNIPSYTWSSHSREGTARVSLDMDEALEDDFQTLYTPVHCVMQQEDNGCQCSAEGRPESSRGSPGQWTEYRVDVGGEEETLETDNPTWRTTCWLHLAVQGISDDEVPWYKLNTPLMVGAKGAALSLAKHLLTIWRWGIKVQGWDVCPPTPTAQHNHGSHMYVCFYSNKAVKISYWTFKHILFLIKVNV